MYVVWDGVYNHDHAGAVDAFANLAKWQLWQLHYYSRRIVVFEETQLIP
jgi:hypothetical protein